MLKKIAPTSKKAKPAISFSLTVSLRKNMPNIIMNKISTLVKRAALTAVIWFKPFKYSAGAIAAPNSAVKNRVK